jgi:predicted nuclease with TOPRIM domain
MNTVDSIFKLIKSKLPYLTFDEQEELFDKLDSEIHDEIDTCKTVLKEKDKLEDKVREYESKLYELQNTIDDVNEELAVARHVRLR